MIEHVAIDQTRSNGRFVDRVGMCYGRLTVLSFMGRYSSPSGKSRRYIWQCQCICGKKTRVSTGDLTSGHTTSCGCWPREKTRNSPGRYRKAKGVSAFNQVYYAYKRSAKKRGLAFDLSPDEFRAITQRSCFYCDLPPLQIASAVKGTNGDYIYTGIDRINNTHGYTIENIRPCCKQCNYAKRNLTEQEFYEWAKRLSQHLAREER